MVNYWTLKVLQVFDGQFGRSGQNSPLLAASHALLNASGRGLDRAAPNSLIGLIPSSAVITTPFLTWVIFDLTEVKFTALIAFFALSFPYFVLFLFLINRCSRLLN